jgi:hypothetical protein
MLRAILFGAVVVLAGCAATPAGAPPTASSAAAPQSQLPPCAPQASRIPTKDCGPGRTWDQKDLSSTGRGADAGAALNMLDPSLHVH